MNMQGHEKDARLQAAALVRDARGQLGLTQEEFASRYGTSQSLLSKYERGAVPPPADMLVRCLEVLKTEHATVTQEDLLKLVRTRLAGDEMSAARLAIAKVITCLPTRG